MAGKTGNPMKTTINLAQKEGISKNIGLTASAICLALVAALLFGGFGVYRPMVVANELEARAVAEEALLETLREKTADYDTALKQYQMEEFTQLSLNGRINPMDCLSLIERELLNSAKVSSFTVASEVITVKLSDVTLNNISTIYQRLMADKMVSGVQVYTAATQQERNQKVTASMTISLASPPEEMADGGEEVAL